MRKIHMKVTCFLENIFQGAESVGIAPDKALMELKASGLDLIYAGGWILKNGMQDVLKAMMDAAGVGLEGMFWFYDFGNHPEDTSYRALIDATAELGGTNVLLVPGMTSVSKEQKAGVMAAEEKNRKHLLENMVIVLRNAVAYGATKGVAVSMEDFDGMEAPYCTAKGLQYFMEAVPGLQCSFDTGNFIMYHEDELSAFELFRDRLCTVHLKDRAKVAQFPDDQFKICADGSKVYTPAVGSGYIRMAEILEQLKLQQYSGNVIVELFDHSPSHMLDSLKQSVQWVKKQIAL